MNVRTLSIARSIAVIGGTAALIVGATYAASTGSVTLTANTFAASQGLQISNGGNYGDTATGFDFGTTPIGNEGSAKQHFFLKDISGSPTPVTISVLGATCGAFTGLDTTKVHVNIEKNGGATVDAGKISDICTGTAFNLSNPQNSPELAGVGTEYDIWMTLDAGAITGTPAGATFDLNFAGTE